MEIEEKIKLLRETVRGLGSAVVAFSGGVDSALLSRIAAEELRGRVVLVTADSETYTSEELERAKIIAADLGAPHLVIHTNEIESPLFSSNPPDRCYHCKRELMERLDAIRRERGYEHIADGANADDAADYRPGDRAAREYGARRPIAETGLTKNDVREISKFLSFPGWDLPAAACLASRIPYGVNIEKELLKRIEAAEKSVKELAGVRQVRVRHHGDVARIEVPQDEMEKLARPDVRRGVVDSLRALGYHYVALDLLGYRTGSLNEILPNGKSSEKG